MSDANEIELESSVKIENDMVCVGMSAGETQIIKYANNELITQMKYMEKPLI